VKIKYILCINSSQHIKNVNNTMSPGVQYAQPEHNFYLLNITICMFRLTYTYHLADRENKSNKRMFTSAGEWWYHQRARCSKICFIDSFKLVLLVSGDSFAHLQEHFVYTAFWNNVCCLLPTGDTDWMKSIKQILLHPVGCWYHCTSDARSHKRQLQDRFEVSNRYKYSVT